MTTIVIDKKKSVAKAELLNIKADQKERAANIRKLKSQRKEVPFGYVPGLESASWEYRHFHIAYCELRGRTREQIERHCDESPDERWIARIKETFERHVDEVLQNMEDE